MYVVQPWPPRMLAAGFASVEQVATPISAHLNASTLKETLTQTLLYDFIPEPQSRLDGCKRSYQTVHWGSGDMRCAVCGVRCAVRTCVCMWLKGTELDG
jgi:hypothetical protein